MTKVLVFGVAGQLGNALGKATWPDGWNVTALDMPDVDFTDTAGLRALIADQKPELIINAAAYTAVDKAETETVLNWQINALAPAAIAEAAAKIGAAMAHVSTDYVYDGAKEGPWVEDDPLGPLGAYGSTKVASEMAVKAVLERHLILRTSWVYASHGNNFVKTMLRVGKERDTLTVVDDQWGRPTDATDLGNGIIHAAHQAMATETDWGTYQFSNSGDATTWARFAREIFALAEPWNGKGPEVVAIPTSEYPTPARRPANSVMSLDKWQATFGYAPRPWPEALAEVLSALKDQ
jgi:dTDP-4-dehydrorhamnose reductase